LRLLVMQLTTLWWLVVLLAVHLLMAVAAVQAVY
jgi:hypothetical protein